MSGVSEAQREHIWQEAAKVVMNPHYTEWCTYMFRSFHTNKNDSVNHCMPNAHIHRHTHKVEPLYRGHHLDPANCPVYSGVLYTLEPLYRGHHWDPAGCSVYSGTSL